MNIPDKEEISRLGAAIMRRVEFDQSIHASSIEDEIGKWVREYLEPKKTINVGADFGVSPATVKPDWVAWSTYAEKMAHKVALDAALYSSGYMLDDKHVPAQQVTSTQVRQEQAKLQTYQRSLQALAQQKFNQQIADNYGGLVSPPYQNLSTAGDMIVGRETNASGHIIEIFAKSDGTTYRRFA